MSISARLFSLVLVAALVPGAAATADAQSSTRSGVSSLWRPATTPARDTVRRTRAVSTPTRPVVNPRVDSSAAEAKPAGADSASAPAADAPAVVTYSAEEVAEMLRALLVDAHAAMTAELAAAMSKVEVEMDSMRREVATSRSETATAKQRADRALAGIGNFRLSGDVRVRYEQQVQGAGFVTRHRERTRARLNLTGDVSERLSGGISIASGDLVDHQSSNQTQTNVFSRKTVGLDRFFIQYKPAGATGFAVIGGKFPYAWERTSLTMSNDINPEGIAPSFTWARKGRLERVAVIGYMLPFWEVSSGDDSYAVGGQLQTRWRLTPKWSARASVGTMAFEGADAIAVAAAKGSVKPSAPSANALRRDSTNTVLGFANNYHLDDVVLRADYSGFAGWPVTLEAHAVRNRFAPSGEGFAYRAGVSAGQLREIKDLQFTWALFHIGREAVIGTLNEQDLRASTNAATHRFGASLRILPNAVFNAALWRGRLLDPRATTSLLPAGTRTTCVGGGACREPWLNRIQVDVAYTF